MTPDIAGSLADIRLRQTAELLEWMLATSSESEPLIRARQSVAEAITAIHELRSRD